MSPLLLVQSAHLVEGRPECCSPIDRDSDATGNQRLLDGRVVANGRSRSLLLPWQREQVDARADRSDAARPLPELALRAWVALLLDFGCGSGRVSARDHCLLGPGVSANG
jgi:hypothetical protein